MSSDIKVQLVIDDKVYTFDDEAMGKLLAACRTKKAFGGTEYKDPEYGSVEVEIGSETKRRKLVVYIGNAEWEAAEKVFGVKGIQGVIKATESEGNCTAFYRIALERFQKGITTKEVADLRDWRKEGEPTLKDAVDRALAFSKPHVFPDEEADPKVVEALKAGLILLTTSPLESPSTT